MKRTKTKTIKPVSSDSDLENMINAIENKINVQLSNRDHIKTQRDFIFKKIYELTNKTFKLNEIPSLIHYFIGDKSNIKGNFVYLVANPICYYIDKTDEDTLTSLSCINKFNKLNNYKFDDGCKKIKEFINSITVINKPAKYCKILTDWTPVFV